MATPQDHDSYIAAVPEAFRPALAHLRSLLARALPEAEEIVAYNMPGFRIGEAIVTGYAAFTKQCGLYVDSSAISAHADEIAAAGLKATKTGITFTVRKPIPDELVIALAQTSRDAVETEH
ncbi:MAG: DUF1801 domain-containing protein [Actinomycetales bacterium]|nr:DUF1801 domain-containing protein [Actinomycetales bacterium]